MSTSCNSTAGGVAESYRPRTSIASQKGSRQRNLGLIAWLVPSMADMLFLVLLGFILGVRVHLLFNADGDLARHLAVGRQILADQAVPTIDLFSHTKGGYPFIPYEWLSEVIYALAYQQLGYGGIAVLAASLAALPFLLLTRWMAREGSNLFLVILLVAVGALATSVHWLARPHLFTILLALLWTRSLQDYQSTDRLRYLAVLPPMMIVWVNLHGGFLVGFVILGVFTLSSAAEGLVARIDRKTASAHRPMLNAKKLGIAGVVSLAAVGINPAGYAVLPHVLSYFQYRFLVDNTMEYLSPNFHDLGSQLFAGLLLLAIVALALTPQRRSILDIALLVVWIFFSLFSARNIPLFVVICLPFLGRLSTGALDAIRMSLWRNPDRRSGLATRLSATEQLMGRPLLPVLGIALAFWVTAGGVEAIQVKVGFDEKKFPVQALPQAEDLGARGNLFNYFPWGGYVLYAGYPKHRVFIDGQTDFYGEELTRDYFKVARLEPGWEDVLDRYQIEWVLFPHQSPLSQMLDRSPEWQLAYQDETADLHLRK